MQRNGDLNIQRRTKRFTRVIILLIENNKE